MRATMNLLSTLAFIAIGLFLPVLSLPPTTTPTPSPGPISLLVLETKVFGDPATKAVGAVMQTESDGTQDAFGQFGVEANAFRDVMGTTGASSFSRTTIDKFPENILLDLIEKYPELYSEALPHLLKKVPLEKLAKKLPKNLLKDLKPEDEKKISPEVLAKFVKLYD